MRGCKGRTISLWMSAATLVVLLLSAGMFTDFVRESWLLHQLGSGSHAEKIEAMRRLGELGSVKAVPVLALQTEVPNEELRIAAIEALGAIGPGAAAAIPRLVDLLLEVEAITAAEKQRGLTPPSFQRSPTRRAASVALGGMGALAVPPLLHELRHGRSRKRIPALLAAAIPEREEVQYDVEAIGAAFQTMGEKGFHFLMAELRDEDFQYRGRVSFVIRRSGAEALPPLVEALRTGDDSLRTWAVYFIGKLGSEAKAALPALLTIVRNTGEDPGIRCQAVRTIVRIDSQEPPVRLLVACLDDPYLDVRCAVIEALGRLGPKAAPTAPRLAQFLSHPEPRVRRTSCEALGEIGAVALPPVLEVLRRGGSTAQRWAAHTVWQIGARDPTALTGIVTALVDGSEVVRAEVRRILDLIGPKSAEALRSALTGENRELRTAAREVLDAIAR